MQCIIVTKVTTEDNPDEVMKRIEERRFLQQLQWVWTLFQRLSTTKRTRIEQRSWVFKERFKRKFCEVMREINLKLEDFATEETKVERSVSSSIDAVHSENTRD